MAAAEHDTDGPDILVPKEGERDLPHVIVRRELKAINDRRAQLSRPPVAVPDKFGARAPALDVVALALSGGGIRSASVSLGVLQALNQHDCLRRIDYLSTVSGGGYIGTALTTTMTMKRGEFVFGESTGGPRPDVKDTGPLGHLRNYSNYLIPFGARDVITALAIITRGLVANGVIVLSFVLLFAAFTIQGSPTRTDLFKPNLLHKPLAWFVRVDWFNDITFGFALVAALLGILLFFGWALWRSLRSIPLIGFLFGRDDDSEFRTPAPVIFAGVLLFIAFFVVTEFQPFVISGMFDLNDAAHAMPGVDYSLWTVLFQRITAVAAPFAVVVTFFRGQIGTLFKSVTTSSRFTTKFAAYAVVAATWIAGAAVPLLIWLGYIYLCFWAVVNDGPPKSKAPAPEPAIQSTVEIKGPGVDMHATIKCGPGEHDPCTRQPQGGDAVYSEDKKIEHRPGWLNSAANALFRGHVEYLYGLVGIILLLLAWFLRPNANSLHQLYRDRLSKAFLFDPNEPSEGENRKAAEEARRSGVHSAVDTALLPLKEKLSWLAEQPLAPYHLINATLNIQGSDYANRRGRNGDFFLFSPFYVGSHATGYARTKVFEDNTTLDLATAMTISGAAFSPNAGAASIRALTPTLALLNVRTGYWLKNPLHVKQQRWIDFNAYLWKELTGRLRETSYEVFLSDGGHIENLGLYELLRRRCRVIIVVDAEADPSLRFPSFIALQRYARIDLGVRINMPWDDVRKTTLRWMGYTGDPASADEDGGGADDKPGKKPKAPVPSAGPHTAIGTIDYDGGETGYLVYIKSSLTGDENDYVRDYARRYDSFPHESTGDQFFSEEQFEVYRALGFHIANCLLNGTDEILVFDDVTQCARCRFGDDHPNLNPVRQALCS
jgi:patatin-like phospholipase